MDTGQDCLAMNGKRLTQSDFIKWLHATLWAGPDKGFLLVLAVCLAPILALTALFAVCIPRWMGRLRYRQHLLMTQDTVPRRTVFYPQYFEIEANGRDTGPVLVCRCKKDHTDQAFDCFEVCKPGVLCCAP